MANKRNKEIWAKEEQRRKYSTATKKLYIYSIISLCVSAILILLFFVPWGGVYNSDAGGYEPPVITGFQTFAAGISGTYSNINVPGMYIFYHFCEAQTTTLGILTVIVFFLTIANIILQIVILATKKYVLNICSVAIGVISFALLLVCFIVSLGIANPLMTGYQCNMKICSYRSFVIIPSVVALGGTVSAAIACVRILNAKKLLK